MASDAHTEFEAATLTYALLSEYNQEFGSEFCDLAFSHDQDRENAEAILASLPPNFIHSLIRSKLPDTTFKSILYNSNPFPRVDLAAPSKLLYERLKRIFMTYRAVGHLRCVHHLCVDPQGLLLFTGSDDSLIKVWHIPSFSLMCTMKGHEDGRHVAGLTMSPDRRLLASWGEDRCVRLWSLVDGQCVTVIPCVSDKKTDKGIMDVKFSPCNRFMAIAADQTVRVLKITELIPCLAEAAREIGEGRDVMASNVMFGSSEKDRYNAYDPVRFLRFPPKTHKQLQLKASVMSVSFSSGGSLMGVCLEDGSVVIVSMSTARRWTIQAHESNAADGVLFMKNDFHTLITWSQKGGEAKLWRFIDKSRDLKTFSVRKSSRRAHLVTVRVNCDASLVVACTSASVFAWRIASQKNAMNKLQKPLLHVDDAVIMTQVSDVQTHPFLPNVFLAVTKSVSAPITIWDVNAPDHPIHTLMIPVEMNRVQVVRWGADGMSVFASDTQGGVFMFKIAVEPECRTMPQFFPSDFTPSVWVPERGQLEVSTREMSHVQPKSFLLDMERSKIYDDYAPYTLSELAMTPVYEPAQKYAWLSEEIWVRRESKEIEVKPEPPAPVPKPVTTFPGDLFGLQGESESTETDGDESDTDAKVSEPSESDPIEGAVDDSEDLRRYGYD